MLKIVLGVVAAVALVGLGAGLSRVLGSSPSAGHGVKVLVVDQQAVLQNSLAGQDIGRQASVLRDQIQKEVMTEQKAIVDAQRDLQKNASVYSPAQREQKLKALDARQQAYPTFEQRKSQILQASVGQASDQVAAALKPILQSLIDENHATLLLDRANVMYAIPAYDVTQEAIKRLNAKLSKVKVVRVNLDSITPDTSSPSAGPKVTPAPATNAKKVAPLEPLNQSGGAAKP